MHASKSPFGLKSLIAAAALAVCAAPQAKAYDYANWNPRSWSSTEINASTGGSLDAHLFLTPRLDMIRAGVLQVPDATVSFSANDDFVPFTGWVPSFYNFDLRAVRGGSIVVHDYSDVSGVTQNASFPLTGDNLLPIDSTQLRMLRRLDNSSDDSVTWSTNFSVVERNFQTARTGTTINGDSTGTFLPAFAMDNSFAINSVFQVADVGDFTPLGSVNRSGSITLGLVNGSEVLDGLYAKDAGWLDLGGDLTLYQNGTLFIRDGEVTSNVYRNDNLGISGEGEGFYETRGTLAFDSGILSVRQRFAQDMAVNEGQTLGFRDGAVNSTTFDLSGGGYWQTSNIVGGFVGGENFYSPFGGDGFFGEGGFFGGEGSVLENAQFYLVLGGGALRSITGNNVQNGNINIGQVAPTYFSIFFDGEGAGFGDVTYARINSDRYINPLVLDGEGAPVRSVLTLNGNINGVNSFASLGGSLAIFGGDGDIIVNGQVGAGIAAIYKDGNGELVLTSANLHDMTYVTSGSVRATHAQAFGELNVEVHAFGLKEFIGYAFGEGEGSAPIGGSVILDPAYSSRGNLTFDNNFILGGFGLAEDTLFGEGVGQFNAGTGAALTTASLVNQSGNNTIDGDIFVGSNVFSLVGIGGEGEGIQINDASILVANGTTLTVTDDVVRNPNNIGPTHLYVAAVNQGLNQGIFRVNGDLLGVDTVTKNGDGLARFTSVDGALNTVNVNAGILQIDGSVNSSALAPYGEFDKNGAGKLEVFGAHHYSNYNFNGGTSDIYGSVTLQGPAMDAGFDIEGGSTVNVESTGSLIHVSSDGLGGSFTNSLEVKEISTLNVKTGGIVNLNGAELDIEDTSSLIVAGTLSSTDGIYTIQAPTITVLAGGIINANIITDVDEEDGVSAAVITVSGRLNGNVALNRASTLAVNSGGVLAGNVVTQDDFATPRHGTTITVSGALNGNVDLNQAYKVIVNSGGVITGNIEADDVATIEIKADGRITGNITAYNDALITLRTGGTIAGNVDTYGDARFIIEANSTHTGDYNAFGGASIVVNGTIGEGSAFAQNFRLAGSAQLSGSGRVVGNVLQTGGVVAPGNSPGILSFGSYTISAGLLEIQIEGTPVGGPGGYDQLQVTGAINISGTAQLNFDMDGGYQSGRGNVFQVLAGSTGEAKASIGQFDTVLWEDSDSRLLFDHSTGRAYGTGLTYGQASNSFQTFRQYANNANRLEIARALWMESIDYDNSNLGLDGEGAAIVDENFASTADDVAAAQAKRGYKAFILTTGTSAEQTATDLGQAAVSVLTAADVGAALDALSPEAYAGITDLGIRVARGFAFLPFNQRRMGAVNEWDFSVGYNNDEVQSDGTSGYNSYKVRSNQVNVTAARDVSDNVRFTFGVGSDEGRVFAQQFSADIDTLGLGLGLALTPDSKAFRVDLGVGLTTSDWDSVRQGVAAGADMDTAAFAARLTINTAAIGNFSYKPFIALSYTDASVDSFVEADTPGSVQLGIDGFQRESFLGELGFDFEYRLGEKTALTGIVSWQHEFQDSGSTDMRASFVEDGVDDTSFSVRSAGFGQDLFRAGLGIRHELDLNSAVSLSYNAVMGSQVSSGQQIRADYTIRF